MEKLLWKILIISFISIIIIMGITFTLISQTKEDKLNNVTENNTGNTKFIVTNDNDKVFIVTIQNREGNIENYKLKVIAQDLIYDKDIKLNDNEIFKDIIPFSPNLDTKDKDIQLEFILYKNNELYKINKFHIPIIKKGTYNDSNESNESYYNSSEEIERYRYITTYKFDTGESIDLIVSNYDMSTGSFELSEDNAEYITVPINNTIVIAGDKYEKAIPGKLIYLYPIIDQENITLKINEIFYLKDGYSFTIDRIDQNLKFDILRNNKTEKEIVSDENSSTVYWIDIDEHRQKELQIDPIKINNETLLSITQYGDRKIITVGSKYGEFRIVNITDDSITMRNFQPINITVGKNLSLMNGKINFKIE